MPLQRRIPKRGFTNIFRREYAVVNIQDLEIMAGADTVTPEMLVQKGLIKDMKTGVKVLGTGELTAKLTVRAHKFSKSAMEKIHAAGGKAEVI
jgi:large subunit ribosomal protein L15